MKVNKFLFRFFALLIIAAFSLTGCDEEESPTDMGAGAELRVIHVSPDAPAVDIYAEGVSSPLIEDLDYSEVSDYLALDPGTYNIQVRAAGSDPGSTPAYETGDLTIPEDAEITAVAVGLLGSSDEADRFRVMAITEIFDDPGTGNVAAWIIHGAPDAPTVSIDVGNDGIWDISDFALFDDTGQGGVLLPSETELQIVIGAGTPPERVTAFTTPGLPDGEELFIIATGLLDRLPREEKGFSLLAVRKSGSMGLVKQNPVVYAVHASPDAPAVDIYAGGAMLVENLDWGQISDPVQVPPGSYQLDFTATGGAAIAASDSVKNLSRGNRYLAIASGYLTSTPEFQLIPLVEMFNLISGDPLVRVVHASPDAPRVDGGPVVEGSVSVIAPDFEDLAFTDASPQEGTAVPAGPITIGIAATGQTTPLFSFDLDVPAGGRLFGLAVGSALSGPGETFHLLMINATSSPWISILVPPNQ